MQEAGLVNLGWVQECQTYKLSLQYHLIGTGIFLYFRMKKLTFKECGGFNTIKIKQKETKQRVKQIFIIHRWKM